YVNELHGGRARDRHRQHDVWVDDHAPQRQDGKPIHLLHPDRLRPRQPRRQFDEPHFEKALLVARTDAFGVHRDGQAEATLEGTDLHFHRVVVGLALVAACLTLARDREDAVHVLDGEVFGPHAGDVHVDDERLVRLEDVGGGLPFGGGDEAHEAAVGDLVEIDFELLGGMHRERARAPRGAPRRAAGVSHGAPPRWRGPVPRTGGTAPSARAPPPSLARWWRRPSW